MLSRFRCLVVACLLVAATSSAALADDMSVESGNPAMIKPFSAALLLGYGISLEDINPWGFGFGIRGGYNFDAIFVGARFGYFLGTDLYSLWELGAEVGYDFYLAPSILIRPGLGLGLATLVFDIPEFAGVVVANTSTTELYVAPGATFVYDIDATFFVGGEARLKFVLANSTVEGLILQATGGMRF